MGIDLGDVVVRRPTSIPELSGKRLAFDAWNILYQFLASIRQPDGTPLADREGRVTSHLAGVLYRTTALVEAGVRPVFVFDGEPHPLKSETLAERAERKAKAASEHEAARTAAQPALAQAEQQLARAKQQEEAAATPEARAEARIAVQAARRTLTEVHAPSRTKAMQTSRLTVPMVGQAQELLRALGIPVLQAPGEGEAQAAWMAQQGRVDGVVSQDFDALLFGTPVLVRNLSVGGRRKVPGKQVWVDAQPETVPLADSLAQLGITRDQLIDAALLVGTDFHPGIRGIGAKKAVQLILRAGSLEALLARLDASPASADGAAERAVVEQRDALGRWPEVRRIFAEPAHTDLDMPAQPMDADAVRRIMVDRHGFAAERVEAVIGRLQAARGRKAQARLF